MSVLNVVTVKPEQAVYTLVVGLGKTGLSVVRYLRALGEAVIVVDSRDIPPGLNVLKEEYGDVECITGRFDRKVFVNAHRIVVSPGVALNEPALLEARKNNIEIIGDIDLFAHEAMAPVVGITGSNGKSTVTTLVTLMAAKAGLNAVAGGNIGTPVLETLDDDVALYVLELSSLQLETLNYLPMKAAVVLNISADHMDRYQDINDYRHVKETIYNHCENKVINKQEQDILANYCDEKVILFGSDRADGDDYGISYSYGKARLTRGNEVLLSEDNIKLKGTFNYLNILAAIALLQPLHLNKQKLITAIQEFKGLTHRCEWITAINHVDFYNDSKGTNPGATIAALNSFSQPEILIAGGVGKDADFTELGILMSEKIKACVLLGTDADKIKAAALRAGTKLDLIHQVNSMQEAINTAFKLAERGDVVVFSPACASFDMYKNYIERGEDFTHRVLELGKKYIDKNDFIEQLDSSQRGDERGGYQNAS